jgi:hypothetical protein
MIATALQNTGDLLKARAEFMRARTEAEDAVRADESYRSTLTKIREGIAELEGVLGRLRVRLVDAPQGTAVTVDGEPVPAAKLVEPLFVAAGSVTVEATAPDGTVARQVVSINAGGSAAVELLFTRPQGRHERARKALRVAPEAGEAPPPSGGNEKNYTPALVAGSIGIAGIATFAVFGVLSNSKYDALEKDCPVGHCTPDHDSDISQGKRFQTIANVGLGVGIAGAVTSAALIVFDAGSNSAPKQGASARVGIGIGSIDFRESF